MSLRGGLQNRESNAVEGLLNPAPPELTIQERVAATSDQFLRHFVNVWILLAIAAWLFEAITAPDVQYPAMIMLVAGLASKFAIRADRIVMARYLIIGLMTVFVLITPLLLSGVRTPVLINMTPLLLLTGWLLGRRAAAFLTSLFCLSVILYWQAEARQWLDLSAPIRPSVVWMMVWFLVTAITGVIIWYLVKNHETNFSNEAELQRQLASALEDAEATNRQLNSVLKFNESILNNSPLPMAVFAAGGQCVEANAAYAQLFGATREALQGFHSFTAWHESELLGDCLSALTQGTPQQREIHDPSLFGRDLWLEYQILPIQLNGAKHLLIQFVDLTEQKHAEIALETSKAHLQTLIRTIPDLIWLKDPDGVYLACNTMFERFIGTLEANIVGKTDYDFVDKELADFLRQNDRNAMVAAKPVVNEETVNFADDGHHAILETIKAPIHDSSGQLAGVLGIARDITERKRLEQELANLAYNDALTKLPNRRLLLDRLSQALHNSKRQNSYGALLFLDLNKFKALNDAHGHEAGDQLLIEVARRLKQVTRDTDTVARLGGDEFVVLLEGLGADADRAAEYASLTSEKIRESLTEEYVLGDIHHHGSASTGITLFFGDEADPDQIIKDADAAMYEAKRGRER